MEQKSKTNHTESDFIPPEEVAEREDAGQSTVAEPDTKAASIVTPKKKFRFHFTKKQWTTAGIIAAVLLIGGGYLAWKLLQNDPPKPVFTQQAAEPTGPVKETSALTGLPVANGTNASTPVTAVMIENSPDARPQAGLKDAGVIYEAIAEGGITRFVAFFQEAKPNYIGPVRSVRPYYLDFVKPYDAPVAHAGGSGQALAMVRSSEFKDLDQFFYPSYYQRISSRYAPHNLYTSRAQLLELQKSKGWTTSKFTGLSRAPAKAAKTVTAKTIDLTMSSYLYNPHYVYDKKANNYKRSEGGQPHTDDKSGKQLAPNVVVALVMPQHYEGIYSVYQTTGKGQAYLFQNGTVTKAQWHKSKRSAQLTLVDGSGKEIGLNPGQTWFTLVSSPADVAYAP